MNARVSQKEARRVGRTTSLVSAAVNSLLVAIKLILGTLSGSAALIADGIHSLADMLTDILTLVAVHIGRAEADDSHPYGHGKFETFGALLLSVILALTGVGLIYDAGFHLYNDVPQAPLPVFALYAAFASILLNEILFRYCLREGIRVQAPIIIANAWHHRADGLSSLAALIGIGLSIAGFPIFDSIAAILVALVIIKMSYTLGRESFDELVDAAVDSQTQAQINTLIVDAAGVRDCHMMRARKLGGQLLIDVHVDVDGHISVSEGHIIAERVEHALKTHLTAVAGVIVHIDPKDAGSVSPTLPSRSVLKKKILDALPAPLAQAQEPHILLHYFNHHMEADLFFPANLSAAVKKAQPALEEKLQLPHGPFKVIRCHLSL